MSVFRSGKTEEEMGLQRTLVGTTLFLVSYLAAAETPVELWRQGYEIIWQSPYEDVEECTPDNAVVLSQGYVFICNSYEYVYHYGGVFVASRALTHNGKTFYVSYLCMDGGDRCLSGNLVKGR
jgi:hypothetical protein